MTDLVRPVWRNLECPVDIWGPTGTEASPRRAKYLSLIYSRSEINGGPLIHWRHTGESVCTFVCLDFYMTWPLIPISPVILHNT